VALLLDYTSAALAKFGSGRSRGFIGEVGEGGEVRKPQAMGWVPLDQPGLLKLNEGSSKRINVKLHSVRDKTGIAAFILVDLRQGKEEGREAAGRFPIETDNLIAPELKLAPNRCIIAAERSCVIG
jgi:hypothetical protein